MITNFYTLKSDTILESAEDDDGAIQLMLYCLGYFGIHIADLNAPTRRMLMIVTMARLHKGSARELYWALVGMSSVIGPDILNGASHHFRESIDVALGRHAGSPSLKRHAITGLLKASSSLGLKWTDLSPDATSALRRAIIRLLPSTGSDGLPPPLQAKAWKSLLNAIRYVDIMCDGDWILVLSNSDSNSDSDSLVDSISSQFDYARNAQVNHNKKEKSGYVWNRQAQELQQRIDDAGFLYVFSEKNKM